MTAPVDLVLGTLRSRPDRTAFVTELYRVAEAERGEIEDALVALERDKRVLVQTFSIGDPHLADVDLRIAGLIDADTDNGRDALGDSVARIDAKWREWVAEFLANHRCT